MNQQLARVFGVRRWDGEYREVSLTEGGRWDTWLREVGLVVTWAVSGLTKREADWHREVLARGVALLAEGERRVTLDLSDR
jgi:hypothetical protein